MTRQPLSREGICDALESCRPGSDDLFTPELAEIVGQMAGDPNWEHVYERIQNFDLKISAAYHDVEIPPDLEKRLLAEVQFRQVENALYGTPEEEAIAASATDPSTAPTPKKERAISRRRFVLTGGILAAAASLFLVVYLEMNKPSGYSKQTVQDEAMRFFIGDRAAPGQLLALTPSPRQFPLSRNIRLFRETRWRTVQGLFGQSGVAFDLPAQDGGRATLYVVERTVADLDDLPVGNPSNTGGCCVAAWQEDGLLYVLVVRGNRKTYQEYLVPRGPIA